jgi:hypothetical protein
LTEASVAQLTLGAALVLSGAARAFDEARAHAMKQTMAVQPIEIVGAHG